MTPCACGCGETTTVHRGRSRRFVRGHNPRGREAANRRGYVVEDRGYETPCHIWTGVPDRKDYARVRVGSGGKRNGARLAWEAVNGPMPAGLVPDHLCRQRACVRPDHIEPVTSAENTRRGVGTRLTADDVGAIRSRYAAGEKQTRLAAEFGIRQGSIANIVARRSWAEV